MLRKIARNIQQAKFYSVMGDETADISNKEQLILCIRWVNDNLQAHEDFIGIHKKPNTTADEIVKVIKVINVIIITPLIISLVKLIKVTTSFAWVGKS